MDVNSSPATEALLLAGAALDSDEKGPVLVGGRCGECGARTFPAYEVCPSCGAERIEKEKMPREGNLYAFSKVYVGPAKWHKPFTVGYVDLENGVRVFAHLKGNVQIGQRVHLSTGEVGRDGDGMPLTTFLFEPAE